MKFALIVYLIYGSSGYGNTAVMQVSTFNNLADCESAVKTMKTLNISNDIRLSAVANCAGVDYKVEDR